MRVVFRDYSEGLAALYTLEHAHDYIAKQFAISMNPIEAHNHFCARQLLLKHRFMLLDELERSFKADQVTQ